MRRDARRSSHHRPLRGSLTRMPATQGIELNTQRPRSHYIGVPQHRLHNIRANIVNSRRSQRRMRKASRNSSGFTESHAMPALVKRSSNPSRPRVGAAESTRPEHGAHAARDTEPILLNTVQLRRIQFGDDQRDAQSSVPSNCRDRVHSAKSLASVSLTVQGDVDADRAR